MAAITYLDAIRRPGPHTVTGIGSQPGPVGGDGWQVVASLPTSALQSSHKYAFLVTGKVMSVTTSGATPVNGKLQVCLGDGSGLKHPDYCLEWPLSNRTQAREAIPFQFLVLFTPTISDALWGASWPNTYALTLYARSFWNGDQPAYSASFQVAEVNIVWVDYQAIPTGDVAAEQFTTVTNLGTTQWNNLFLTAVPPGNAGEKWMHFCQVTYAPSSCDPQFQFGSAGAGGFASFAAKIGTNGRWGMSPTGTAVLHQGAFFWQVQPAATFSVGVRGYVSSPTGSTSVRRFRVLSLRLDNLTDVITDGQAQVDSLATSLATGLDVAYWPVEVASANLVSQPCLFLHGIPQPPTRTGYGIVITTELGTTLHFNLGEPVSSPTQRMGDMAFSTQALGPSMPDVQYRNHWLGLTAPGLPFSYPVRDVFMVAGYFVANPDRVATVPARAAGELAVVPGAEGPLLASAVDLPTVQDAENGEDSGLDLHEIRGATGYSRRWPTFVQPRRAWSLRWSLGDAAARAMQDFLVANLTFRFQPTRESSKVVVMQTTRPTLEQQHGRTFVVSTEVIELLFLA